ncbi:MAG: hypothetical protein C5B43_01230 [Verrucomicrobia bacterium]|nr:MAG: hypothetical protein C5B43_01230 [Verrucomicrobiota bacterium]
MLTSLIAALKSEIAIVNSKEILWNAYCILHLLEDQYIKDGNLRDAAIDEICSFLQSKKSQHAETTISAPPPKLWDTN